ncbi:hypothetical protein [Enterococcus sp. 1001283B150225_161107_E12]|uniref:hypothetical protein n=1 Tax=Enterococcus sp. 1001283B150225_161107_E12 TaxID=2787145 RepID=UPI002B4B9A6D|nr:hypothetical protein [Enterococcus sp. 1001283B150225_161107_E12]
MGLIYSATESSNLMSNLTTNLSLTRTTITQLRTGSQQVVNKLFKRLMAKNSPELLIKLEKGCFLS